MIRLALLILLLLGLLALASAQEKAPPTEQAYEPQRLDSIYASPQQAQPPFAHHLPELSMEYTPKRLFPTYQAPAHPIFMRGAKYIIPAMLIGGGILSSRPLRLSPANKHWRENIRARTYRWLYVDDVAQYVPLLTTCALQLFYGHGRSTGAEFIEAGVAGGMVLALMVNISKLTVRSLRPDGTTYNSFPSGHTSMAFFGAEMQRYEYGQELPLLASQGYLFAIITGALRIYHNRHWVADVMAGAGVGIASVWIGHALQPYIRAGISRLFPRYARRHRRSRMRVRLDAPSYGMGLGLSVGL